jgi:hypothetical protein
MLGHANIRQTMDTYSHVLPNMQLQAAARMDEMLGWRASAVALGAETPGFCYSLVRRISEPGKVAVVTASPSFSLAGRLVALMRELPAHPRALMVAAALERTMLGVVAVLETRPDE